jgi:hypothetical protein
LKLEGIALRGSGPAALVCCERAALHLTGCRIVSPNSSTPIVCRDPGRVVLEDCTVEVHSVALYVEAGAESPCEIHLHRSAVRIGEEGGAALALCGRSGASSPVMHLKLKHNTLVAGRLAGVRGLTGGLHVIADENDVTFREALLSFDEFVGTAWRKRMTWRGRGNRYTGPAEWVHLNGLPAGVRGIGDWRTLWGPEN